jgi:hypothetical protein
VKDNLPNVGNLEIKPDSNITYKLIATAPDGKYKDKEAKVKILYNNKLYASSVEVYKDESVTLLWRFKGLKVLSIEEETLPANKILGTNLASEGQIKISKLSKLTQYAIKLSNPNGKITIERCNVGIIKPEISYFSFCTQFMSASLETDKKLEWKTTIL